MARDDLMREALGLEPIQPGFGRHIRHTHGGRWERKATKKGRMFHQNVHKKRVFINGAWIKVPLTTRDMRTLLKTTSAH
ncbi:MAG: mitochondrial large ribosomal subunit protein bL28m [Chloroflexi bacterium]|nr:mitochondrial large ribosomal subunit protein bL28m [Chloroflexota bacterium]